MDCAVDDGDGPVAVVEFDVVATAEQGEVCDGGGTAAEPGDQVVGVALDRRSSADHAAAVAGVEGATHPAGD
jgi:hypothetical protein